jgi:hypothetical protein
MRQETSLRQRYRKAANTREQYSYACVKVCLASSIMGNGKIITVKISAEGITSQQIEIKTKKI